MRELCFVSPIILRDPLISSLMLKVELKRAYLVGYFFWLAVARACPGLAMILNVAGASWNAVVRRSLEAGASMLRPVALHFAPVRMGLPASCQWARARAPSAGPAALLTCRRACPGVLFFAVRPLFYVASQVGPAHFPARCSQERDKPGDPELTRRPLLARHDPRLPQAVEWAHA